MSTLTYKTSGVNYDLLDKLKRMAQEAGNTTLTNVPSTLLQQVSESRGESAAVFVSNDRAFAFVQEGLGTKNLVADAIAKRQEKTYYDAIAKDTVAMIINDLITVGARPVTILAYWAVGSEQWLTDEQRMQDLIAGWKNACDEAEVIWAGGETPTLSGIIHPGTIDLAGSAFGIIDPKSRVILGEKLQVGDAIIVFESSGIHANGLSLARKLAEQLPQGYDTKISDGRTYGEALLDPTLLYAKLIRQLFDAQVDIHYMANITGHGWRKLMRNKKELTYRIHQLPPVPAVLEFIVEKAALDDVEAYGNLNMGAGFAIFVSQDAVQTVLTIAKEQTLHAYSVGVVEKGEKKVIIEPKHIHFKADTLQVRG